MKIKKITLIFGVLLYANTHLSQNVFPSNGNAGIGISSPQSNFQIHGITDYVVGNKFTGTINYGKTSRIQLTSTNSGYLKTDGLEIRYSKIDATIRNQEANGNIGISTNGATMLFDGGLNRIGVGGQTLTSSTNFGYFNIQSSGDNGLYIRTFQSGNFGARVEVLDATTNALEVVNSSNTSQKNFSVNGGGVVYARKYTTTLNNIPDYVFSDDYCLMDMDSLQLFITEYNHLPNVPSASEYAEAGVDIGEMNRLLLEKVEELTLYILQLKKEIAEIKVSE